MILEPACCPTCHTPDVVKNGKRDEGKQRYPGLNTECSQTSFTRDYTYRGYSLEVKRKISDMAMNGSGIQGTDWVLKVNPTTVIEELKKHRHLESFNRAVLEQTPTPPTTALIVRVDKRPLCNHRLSLVLDGINKASIYAVRGLPV